MIRRVALLLLAVLIACESTPTPTPTQSASATLSAVPQGADMTDVLARTALPVNDPFALTRALRGRNGVPGPWEPVRSGPLNRQVGDRDEFWFYNERTKAYEKLMAVVRQRSDHAYWYFQDGIAVDPAKLQQTVLFFEGKIYPTDHSLFGEEWSPGIDADPRITILVARIPDVGGYFTAADEVPRWVNPYSNEREMLYVNIEGAPVGSSFLLSTLAHEFSHMIDFAKRKPSSVWFNEGQAQTAEQNNGFTPTGTAAQFLRQPDTQLTDWGDTASQSGANYGHAFLFLQYLSERFGGPPLIRQLMDSGVLRPGDIDAAIKQHGGTGIEDAYLDFVATIGMLDQTDPPAPYRYTALDLPVTLRAARGPVPAATDPARSVHQFAVRYFDLPAGTVSIDLSGATQVRLLPTDPRSGKNVWWSNRGDGSDTTLTRNVDLRAVDKATLTYSTWFDIEDGFDYAYVEASADGGKTWTTLRTGASTDKDPNGTNLGNGVTGKSGGGVAPKWIADRVDLSAYAHKEIEVRFEYVTDQALNKDGFAVDDLAIPEAGWSDDTEADRDWTAAGFVRSSNVVRERFVAQVLNFGTPATVTRATTGLDGKLHLDATIGSRGGLLAVTAFAAETTQPGAFQLHVTRQ